MDQAGALSKYLGTGQIETRKNDAPPTSPIGQSAGEMQNSGGDSPIKSDNFPKNQQNPDNFKNSPENFPSSPKVELEKNFSEIIETTPKKTSIQSIESDLARKEQPPDFLIELEARLAKTKYGLRPVFTGKPVHYHPEIGNLMYRWFANLPKVRVVSETMVWKNGEVREVTREVACPPPHFSEFARELNITESRLKGWAKKHPEFREAYLACKAIIKEFMIDNGLLGKYQGQFAQFTAKNITDMKDKTVEQKQTVDINKLLDQIEKSNDPRGAAQAVDAADSVDSIDADFNEVI